MFQQWTSATLSLPAWASACAQEMRVGPSDAERMLAAIQLAQRNIDERTGGPFAAIIVDESTGACVSLGVNCVVASGTSLAHAETLAILLAQQRVGTHDLASDLRRRFALYASGQPCVMCFGVLWWSGVTKLVCGARGEDVERIAQFREGPLPVDWPQLLARRAALPAIEVVQDVLRDEACAVLEAYAAAGLPVYNPGASRAD
jgi:tRNA(Arg) A34 adenosine deaminase TadA